MPRAVTFRVTVMLERSLRAETAVSVTFDASARREITLTPEPRQ